MREVKIVLASLHNKIDQLFHSWIVALQVERDQLGYVELQVLSDWRRQVRVDTALCELYDRLRLARVQRYEHRNGIFIRR